MFIHPELNPTSKYSFSLQGSLRTHLTSLSARVGRATEFAWTCLQRAATTCRGMYTWTQSIAVSALSIPTTSIKRFWLDQMRTVVLKNLKYSSSDAIDEGLQGEGRHSALSCYRDDEQVMSAVVEKSEKCLKHASERLRDNKPLILKAIKKDWKCLQHASERLRSDPELVFLSLESDRWHSNEEEVMNLVPLSAFQKRDFFLHLVSQKECGKLIQWAPLSVRNDREVALSAIKNGAFYWDIPESLHEDPEIFLALLSKCYWHKRNLQSIPKSLQVDRETAMLIAQKAPHLFQHLPLPFKTDREIVLTAVKNGDANILLSEGVPPAFREDWDLACAALTGINHDDRNPLTKAIRTVFGVLLDDEKFIAHAIEQDGRNFKFASLRLRGDKTLALAAVRKENYLFLNCIAENLRNDAEFMRQVIEIDSFAFRDVFEPYSERTESFYSPRKDIPLHMLDHHGFMLALVQRYGHGLGFVSPRLQKDPTIVIAALKNSLSSGWYVRNILCADERLSRQVLQEVPDALQYVGPKLQGNREIVLSCLQRSAASIQWASNALKDDPDIARQAILVDAKNFLHLGPHSREQKDLITLALRGAKHKGHVLKIFKSLSLPHRNDPEIILCALQRCNDNIDCDRWISYAAEMIQLASDIMKDNPDVAREAILMDPRAFLHLGPHSREQKELIMLALVGKTRLYHLKPEIFKSLSHLHRHDPEIVLCALQHWLDESIDSIPVEMRMDRKIVLAAIEKNPKIFMRLDPFLKKDPEILALCKTSSS